MEQTSRLYRPRLTHRAGVLFLAVAICVGVVSFPSLKSHLERNLGMVLLSKGLFPLSSICASCADAVEGMLANPQFSDWTTARRMSYQALSSLARGDWAKSAQWSDAMLALPQNIWEPLAYTAVANRLALDGNGFLSIGNLDQAEAMFRTAVALDPSNGRTRGALADFLEYYRHDLAGTVLQLEAMVELNPIPQQMLALAARYRYVKRFDDAARVLDQVGKQFPGNKEALAIERGWLAIDRRETTVAIQILELAIKSFPRSSGIWYVLSVAYEAGGRTEDSLQAVQESIKLDPKSAWAYLQAARTLLAHNRPEEAEGYSRALLALDIKGDRAEVLALAMLGDVYVQMKRNNPARESFCQARSINRWGERADYINQQIKLLGECDGS